jgi:hypothetical protein
MNCKGRFALMGLHYFFKKYHLRLIFGCRLRIYSQNEDVNEEIRVFLISKALKLRHLKILS